MTKKQDFVLSGFDVMDVDGAGRACGAYWSAGYKDYAITGLGPVVL